VGRFQWREAAAVSLLLSVALPAAARPAPVARLQAEAGLGGWVRPGMAAPVRVLVANGPEPLAGRLEVRVPGGVPSTAIPVRLPRGARHRYTLFIPEAGGDDAHEAVLEVRLRVLETVVARQRCRAQRLPARTRLEVLIAGGSPPVGVRAPADVPRAAVPGLVRLPAVDVPTHWAGLAAADALRVEPGSWGELEPDQRRAVRQWRELHALPPLALEGEPWARAAASEVPQRPSPRRGLVVGWAVLYVLVFGPFNLWALRRLRWTALAWLFTPGLALALTGAVLVAGRSWGNHRAVFNVVTVLQAESGAGSARQESLLGLFSPVDRPFRLLTTVPAPVLREVGALPGGPGAPARRSWWPALQDDEGARFEGKLSLYTLPGLRLTGAAELGGTVVVRPLPGGAVEIRNDTRWRLRQAVLASGRCRAFLGELAPRSGRRISLAAATAPVAPGSGRQPWPVGPAGKLAPLKAAVPPAPPESRSGSPGRPARLLESLALAAPSSWWLAAELVGYAPRIDVPGVPPGQPLTLLAVRGRESAR
jgi:hypothetical protein